MAAVEKDLSLPDMQDLTETEKQQLVSVLKRAREFEAHEEKLNLRQPLEGQLFKYTNVMKGWQYRWFTLDPSSGMLEYFEKEEYKKGRPRGSVHLAGAVISPSDEDSQTFTLHAANGEIYRLKAFDARERQHWVNRLRATAEYHTETIAQHLPPLRHDKPQTHSSTENVNRAHRPPDLHSNTSNTAIVRSQYKTKRENIVGDPFKSVKEILHTAQENNNQLFLKINDLPTSGGYVNSLDRDMLIFKATSQATMSCLHECLSILQHQHQVIQDHHASNQNKIMDNIKWIEPMSPISNTSINYASSHSGSIQSMNSAGVPTELKGARINHDEDMEDVEGYSECELGAVEEHKSVILHLLSQLKLGMDLTKVVLPTFILEKRSLLEMFADCMSHPGPFLKITDLADPEARMLAVVEWYLTSFHAGRKGSIAKKPYNPIIGETFHCSWEVPRNKSSQQNKETDSIRMTYCAEQVSHHPPISGIYFECPEKKMWMNASIWTKSKFMGMSIGVVMVGKVTVHLMEHDEEYTFSLPSAYARSILTVPWVELGDKISITCNKTNMSASITFHTKPFYGGKLHRITAEVKNQNTGSIICRANGEWNGSMEFSYANGQSKVVDTTKLDNVKKRVRPLEKQGDYESRKLWQHVTNSLRIGDENSATEHKRFLEERQREGERLRRETNSPFPTKFFHKEGDTWLYNEPLSKQRGGKSH